MFNTIVQPTGVYGPFQSAWANNNNKQAFSKFCIKEPETNPQKQETVKTEPKKSLAGTIAKTAGIFAVAAFAIVAGVPAIRDKFKCFSKEELAKAAKPVLGSETLGRASKAAKEKFVESADFIEKKFQIPLRRFLYENVFKFINYYPDESKNKKIMISGRIV